MNFIVCNKNSAIIASLYREAVNAAQTIANETGEPCRIYRLPPLLVENVIRPLKVEETEAPKPTKKAKRK
jgi:hypothetical protein